MARNPVPDEGLHLPESPTSSWQVSVTCIDLAQPLCRVERCRAPLAGRRTAYCSDAHSREFERNHVWFAARRAARRRARWACERCGFRPAEVRRDPAARARYKPHERRLEVNHVVPLVGAYRLVSCANHLTNLEVLCHACHVSVTGDQRAGRRAEAGSPAPVSSRAPER